MFGGLMLIQKDSAPMSLSYDDDGALRNFYRNDEAALVSCGNRDGERLVLAASLAMS